VGKKGEHAPSFYFAPMTGPKDFIFLLAIPYIYGILIPPVTIPTVYKMKIIYGGGLSIYDFDE